MTATTTFLVGLVAGIFIGAAGEYYGRLFTDQRWQKEAEKAARAQFSKTQKQMPELLEAMKKTLKTHPVACDFTFLPTRAKGVKIARPVYYEYEHPELRGKLATLANRGYISVVGDLSDGTPVYRMSEGFVERLNS